MLRNLTGNTQSLITGLILLMVGVAVLVSGWSYEIGTLRRMGPGYFPMILGASLCLIALLIVTLERRETDKGLSKGAKTPRPLFRRPLFLIPLAILSFALLLESWGLVPAVLVCIGVSGFAERRNRWPVVLAVAFAMVVFTALVFVYGLTIPMRLLVW